MSYWPIQNFASTYLSFCRFLIWMVWLYSYSCLPPASLSLRSLSNLYLTWIYLSVEYVSICVNYIYTLPTFCVLTTSWIHESDTNNTQNFPTLSLTITIRWYFFPVICIFVSYLFIMITRWKVVCVDLSECHKLPRIIWRMIMSIYWGLWMF